MCYHQQGDTLRSSPPNLHNCITSPPTVQAPLQIKTQNGCVVSLIFQEEEPPKIHETISKMLIAAFLRRSCMS